ncbi:MAG TPA: FimV/HubP family polar landmark protein, partial [Fontimonas sp.]
TPSAAPVEAPVYEAPTAAESEAPAASETASAPSATPTAAAAPVPAEGSYGPISAGETLWSIATRARPQGASMDQVLLAIYTGNPGAFDGGINGLRKGAILQLPDSAAVMAVPAAAAKEEVRRLRGLPSGRVSAAPVATPDNTEVAVAEIAPTAAPTAKATATAKPTLKPTAEPTLAPTPEPTLEPTPEPTAEPTTAATPEITPDAALDSPTITAAEPGATIDPSSADITQALATTDPALATSEAPPTPDATPATGDIVVETVKPRRKKEPSLLESLLLPLIAGLAVLGGAYLLYRAIAKRRSDGGFSELGSGAISRPAGATKVGEPVLKPSSPRQKLEDLDRELDLEPPRPTPKAAPPASPAAEIAMATQRIPAMQTETQKIQPAPAPEIRLSNLPLERTAKPDDITLSDTKGADLDFDLTGQFESQTMQINLDTNDPLSEADFHLAYGLFDEAALLLKQAIAREPARTDLQIKLAETYFAAGKAAEFESTASALRPLLTPADWQKVAIMGQQLAPGSSLYATDDAAAPTDSAAVDLDLGSTAEVASKADDTGNLGFRDTGSLDFKLDSFDDPGAPAAAAMTPAPAPAPAPVADAGDIAESIEFDLGEFDLAAPAPGDNAKPAAASDDNLLDFDLEIGDPAKAAIDALDFEAAKGNVDAGIAFDLGTSEVPVLSGKVSADTASLPTQSVNAFNADDVGLDNVDLGDLDGGFAVSGADDAATKLDLARAYVDMGDNEMARSLLGEVMQQGSQAQQQDAATLLKMLA